ncbi:hypothetical protein [Galactobacter valiniphilus]|uniref:hypothetical protein n=1 Tax=Galactobacter valiniphilus TaxID=2676122 RepID=UPI003736018D
MNFTQRVLTGVASVSLAAAGVLGLGAGWGLSNGHGPQGGASEARSGSVTAGGSGLASVSTGSSSAWRTVSAEALLGSAPADVTARGHHRAVAA